MQIIVYSKSGLLLLFLSKCKRQVYQRMLMRFYLTLSVVLTTCIHLSATVYSQTVNLSARGMKLEQTFQAIEKQTGYFFFYRYEDLIDARPITIDLKNASIDQALQACLKDQPYVYALKDNTITIRLNKKQQVDAARQSTVKGIIVDPEGFPLPGVSVNIKGTQVRARSDENGQFVIQSTADNAVLVFTSIGYKPQELAIPASGEIKIIMEHDQNNLNEVVVIGYGESTKRNLTNAVSRLDVASVSPRNVSSANQLLQGQIAGVNLTTANGTPGGASRVSIRGISSINGDNEPLYVIDGIPLSKATASYNFSGEYRQDPLSMINPADIESIDVLKDAAAAAIYGSRATNGVVLITTKQGKSGKPRIALSQLSGLQTMPKKLNLLNPQEYIALQTEATENYNRDMGYQPGQTGYINIANVLGVVPDDPYDVNWQDLIINDPAQTHQTDFSFSGGNDHTTHFTSAGYQYQEGLIKKSTLKRYSVRSNIDFKPNDIFNFGVRLGGNYTHSTSIPNGDQGTALFQRSLEQRPYDRPYLEDGSFAVGGRDILRHNGALILEKDDTFDKNFQGLINLYGNIKFLKHFTWHTGYNAEMRLGQGFRHQKLEHPYNNRGYTNDVRNNRYSATLDNTITYRNSWNSDFNLEAMVGHSYYVDRYDFNQATGTEFPSDDFKHITSATILTADGDASRYAMDSYLGRVTMDYKDRYFLSASARYDGSSKFSKDNRYAAFPAVSGAWAFTSEDFFGKQDWLEFGKLRLSWGKTGNQDGIDNFGYLPLASGGYNYGMQTGLSVNAIGNLDLRWETSTQSDFGLDLSFFKGKLSFTYDYFIKKTDGLLYNLPVLATSGFTTLTSNIGKMENRGHEFTINSVNMDKEGFRWTTSLNISLIRNKVLSLVGEEPIIVGGWSAIIPGQPLGLFYGYKQLGIYQSLDEIPQAQQEQGVRPGDINFQDLDGNGIINASDMMKIGDSQPAFNGGVTNTINYGNFDLTIFNTFSVGNDVAAAWRTGLDHLGARDYGALKDSYENRWTEPGTSNTVPRATKGGQNNRNSSFYIENASFFRIKNLTLGYQLPASIVHRISMSQLRIFASVNNLYTFTKYSGYDPEASMGVDARSFGVDNLVTPQPRSYMLGLNVNF